MAENPGHAVAVVDGRYEIEAIVAQPTWPGRDRIRQLMIARPADLSMEFLAQAMDNVNIVLGVDEREVTIMGGCFDPPQLWVDCSWLSLGTPIAIHLSSGRGMQSVLGILCGLTRNGATPRISLFQDGSISTFDLPIVDVFDLPINLNKRYFFYPGNFVDNRSITGVFDTIPNTDAFHIGGAGTIITNRSPHQLISELEEQTQLVIWFDENYHGHLVFPEVPADIPGLQIGEIQ